MRIRRILPGRAAPPGRVAELDADPGGGSLDDDRAWLLNLGAEVFADLGPYREILTAWLQRSGVFVWLAEDGTHRLGFAMLAFYQERDDGRALAVADLLALAVVPAARRRGVATGLLRHVIEATAHAHEAHAADAIRLTVAADNLAAQALYRRHGFTLDPAATVTYPSGLPALRMVRPR